MATETTSAVTALLSAVSSAFAWALEKLKLKNTKEMQANAAAATEQTIKNQSAATTTADAVGVKQTAAEVVPVVASQKSEERRPLSEAEREKIAQQFVAEGGLNQTRKDVAE